MRLASTFATSGAVSLVSLIRLIFVKNGITGITGEPTLSATTFDGGIQNTLPHRYTFEIWFPD